MVVLPALILVVVACTGAGQSASSTAASPSAASPSAASPGAGTVDVTLQEWAVVPATATAAAGDVTFNVTNTGPDDVHEFVVLRTDLDPGALPTAANGSVDESGDGIEVVDEIEDIPVGETRELSVPLEPGSYVLVCNIFDEAESEAHYQMGMRIGFSVTG
jgi:uncharacterized cupredoxin-like copper-binding protein